PATWVGGQVPTSGDVVRIAAGHFVTIDDTSAVAYTVAIDGKLAFSPSVNTRLKVTNLQVMAGDMGMGTPGVLGFGTGIMIIGKATMHGTLRTPTFVRLAAEPRIGHTTLTLSQAASGWQVGDRLVLPDTRHIKETEVTGSGWVNAVN